MYSLTQIFCTILMSMVLALGCSQLAKKRNRDPMIWFISGLIFGIFALIILLFMPMRRPPVAIHQKSPPPPLLTLLQPDHVGKLWYFIDENKNQLGPMSFEALSRAWKEGKIRDKTYVWNEAMENWQPFQDIIKPLQS